MGMNYGCHNSCHVIFMVMVMIMFIVRIWKSKIQTLYCVPIRTLDLEILQRLACQISNFRF